MGSQWRALGASGCPAKPIGEGLQGSMKPPCPMSQSPHRPRQPGLARFERFIPTRRRTGSMGGWVAGPRQVPPLALPASVTGEPHEPHRTPPPGRNTAIPAFHPFWQILRGQPEDSLCSCAVSENMLPSREASGDYFVINGRPRTLGMDCSHCRDALPSGVGLLAIIPSHPRLGKKADGKRKAAGLR